VKGYTTQHIKKNRECKGAEIIENIVKVQCEICNKEFDNENLLNTHMKSCIEKKALVQILYADPETMLKNYQQLSSLMRILVEKTTALEEENKNLSKRLQKIEKQQDNNGFVELDNEDSNCEYNYNKGANITSRDQVCDFYNINAGSCTIKQIQVEYNGEQKTGLLSISNISIDGRKFVFDQKDKKKSDKLACELKLYDLECCENIATWIKDDYLCCDMHK